MYVITEICNNVHFVQVYIQQDFLAILVTLCRLRAKSTLVVLALANVYDKSELNHTHVF